MLDIEQLRKLVKKKLPGGRYHHSVCVQKEAIRLAKRHGGDWYRAGAAGLLHDICKGESHGEQLKYLQRSDILLDELTLRHPPIWHAIAGSLYLEKELGVRDEDILNAVRYHTTGRVGMSDLEKIVYLADVTSEDRDYPDLEITRGYAQKSLDEGMLYVLGFTIVQMVKKKQIIVQDTWEAYNYYSQILQGPQTGPQRAKEER